jgi:homoserine/homoserine lactone efflux protein
VPLDLWLAFTVTLVAIVLVPGPAVLLVVSHGLAGDRRSGVLAAFGVVASSAAYFLLTATGLHALLLASSSLFEVLRWVGVGYLVWAGSRMIAGSGTAPASAERRPRSRAFLHALALQSGSPNALLFFTAFLPQFIDPTRDTVEQFALLGATSLSVEVVVLGLYVVVASTARRAFTSPRAVRWQERIGGGALLASAFGLAMAGRRS